MRQSRPTRIPIFNLSESQADFASQTFMGSPGRAVGKSLFAAGFGHGGAPPPPSVASPLSRHVQEFDAQQHWQQQQQRQQQQQQQQQLGGGRMQPQQIAAAPDTPRTRAFKKKIGGLSTAVDNARQWEKNFASRPTRRPDAATLTARNNKPGKFAFEASVPRLPEKSDVLAQPQMWDHQKSQQTANETLESFTQQHLREDAQFKAGRLGQGRIERLNQRRQHTEQHQQRRGQIPGTTVDQRGGQPLWGEQEVYEGGKARRLRVQADFEEIRNVSMLPDPVSSGGHAYIAAAGDDFEVFVKPKQPKPNRHQNAGGPKVTRIKPPRKSAARGPNKGHGPRVRRKRTANAGSASSKPLPSYMRPTAATRLWKQQTRAEKLLPKEQRTSIY
jgi:hypothetical protein